MAKYWQTQRFKDLEKAWYAKLKDEGFVDAEKPVGNEKLLKQQSSNVYRQASEVTRHGKLEYYRLLTQYVAIEIFEYQLDKLVMTWKSLGLKIEEICSRFKEIGESVHRQTIRFIIRLYEHKWGIKKWDQKQLNPTWRNFWKIQKTNPLQTHLELQVQHTLNPKTLSQTRHRKRLQWNPDQLVLIK